MIASSVVLPLFLACGPAPGAAAPPADSGDPDGGGTPADSGDSGTEDSALTEEERTGRIELVDPLDEPDRYCMDVPGHDADIQLDGPLQAHSCKDTDDQVFTIDAPLPGMVFFTNYDRCLAAASERADSPLFVRECDEADPLQSWSLDGQARFVTGSSGSLCATAGAESEAANGGFLKRDLALADCAGAEAALSTWEVPGGTLGS